MSEWKDLERGDLPSDILTGKYTFQFHSGSQWVTYVVNGVYEILEELEKGDASGIRYMKIEPKPPSHPPSNPHQRAKLRG